MKTYILIITVMFSILVTMSIWSLNADEVNSRFQALEEESKSLPVGLYLGRLAKKYDCFFTLEEAWQEGESRNAVEGYSVQNSSESRDLHQELEYLRLSVPNLTYEFSKGSPRIVHIMDTRLRYREGYALESLVRSIVFEGPVNDLAAAISKQRIPILPETLFFIGGNEFQDRNTEVRIRGEGLKVREVLTNFLSLEEREGRILWIARTKLGKGEITYVYYPYPGKKN